MGLSYGGCYTGSGYKLPFTVVTAFSSLHVRISEIRTKSTRIEFRSWFVDHDNESIAYNNGIMPLDQAVLWAPCGHTFLDRRLRPQAHSAVLTIKSRLYNFHHLTH